MCFQSRDVIITLNNERKSPVELQRQPWRWTSEGSEGRFFKSSHLDTRRWCGFILKERHEKKKKNVHLFFRFWRHETVGEKINNADASSPCARALIPSGVWLKSPSAPGSKHYYMALCLGFSSQMGIWGPTWRQIGYQSQGWYKDRLWKSISRRPYIGLAYLFLHHCVRGAFISAGFCTKSLTESLIWSHRAGRERCDILFYSSQNSYAY